MSFTQWTPQWMYGARGCSFLMMACAPQYLPVIFAAPSYALVIQKWANLNESTHLLHPLQESLLSPQIAYLIKAKRNVGQSLHILPCSSNQFSLLFGSHLVPHSFPHLPLSLFLTSLPLLTHDWHFLTNILKTI